ncbi:hypothetical protein M8818_001287 [Zalaria obscura]|uniref:Uncharacterized protein n=1 Tax=Zalaria obscura TaxID=2024903 RepID=A0ACC3SLT9_9PEZI
MTRRGVEEDGHDHMIFLVNHRRTLHIGGTGDTEVCHLHEDKVRTSEAFGAYGLDFASTDETSHDQSKVNLESLSHVAVGIAAKVARTCERRRRAGQQRHVACRACYYSSSKRSCLRWAHPSVPNTKAPPAPPPAMDP